MSYATRLSNAHGRIRSKFGTDADGYQLYCWHNGAQIVAYQPSGTRGRDMLSQMLVKTDSITVHATRSEFGSVPLPNDEIKLGTTLAGAATYRVESVKITHMRPFYELELIDPNLATTAP